MSTKQRLLFITTGGTIASVRTQQGLKPVLTSEELLAHLPELNEDRKSTRLNSSHSAKSRMPSSA